MSEKTILGDCPERVALDLAKLIAIDTSPGGPNPPPRDEAYWLGLYAKCRRLVMHAGLPKDLPQV